jgi:predicted AAA+ superfamily ATPase
MYLKPISFEEFLINSGQTILSERIHSTTLQKPLDEPTHLQLLELIRTYLFVGGMPAALKKFLDTKSLLECQQSQNFILQTYQSDFGKYATKAQHKYLQILFERAPGLIGKRFKFSDVDPEVRSRDLKVAVEQLNWAGLLTNIYATNAAGIPLKSQKKEDRFKLLFLDIGLLQCAMEMDYEEGFNQNILQINTGSIAEQFVGQELLAYEDIFQNKELFYWERDKKGSEAEIDYTIQQGAHIFPIEVKAGKTGRLKSLQQFMQERDSKFGIRISQKSLSFDNNILSVPLYLIGQLKRLISEALET